MPASAPAGQGQPQNGGLNLDLVYSAAQEHIFFESEALGRFRFFPKGRRLGFTRGAGQAVIEWLLEGKSVLWGDTVATNIERYVSRYIEPPLKQYRIPYRWRKTKKELEIGAGHCDFRSADRPENWEGFGYDIVLLNEAGIILNDRYLYENAVLPMMMDNPDSTLIAGGTPKLRQGKGRLFQELALRAKTNPEYYTRVFSTYDNPFLDADGITALAGEITEAERPQEIHGQFLEPGGTLLERAWMRTRTPPDKLRRAMGVDLAISTKETADFTACVVVGIDEGGQRYVLDAQRRRLKFHQALEFIRQMAEEWQIQSVRIEEVQFQAAVVQELLRTTDLPVAGYKADRDKVTRAQRVIRRYEAGLYYHAPTLKPEFQDELLAFPIGEHDDQVDALVIADAALADTVTMEFQTLGPRSTIDQLRDSRGITSTGYGTVAGGGIDTGGYDL